MLLRTWALGAALLGSLLAFPPAAQSDPPRVDEATQALRGGGRPSRGEVGRSCHQAVDFPFRGGGRDADGTIRYPAYVDGNADRLQFRRELREAEARSRASCK